MENVKTIIVLILVGIVLAALDLRNIILVEQEQSAKLIEIQTQQNKVAEQLAIEMSKESCAK